MSSDDAIRVNEESLRRLLHDVNNIAAKLLTRAELALLGDDPEPREAALRAVLVYAEELGDVTSAARARLLDPPT